jgi:hypothetical protein
MQLHTDNKFSLLSIYNTHTGRFLFSESHSFNHCIPVTHKFVNAPKSLNCSEAQSGRDPRPCVHCLQAKPIKIKKKMYKYLKKMYIVICEKFWEM